ncbi:MAG: hypothetical protein WCX97_02035 [Candidatus Magasanikbacteria bacterium]
MKKIGLIMILICLAVLLITCNHGKYNERGCQCMRMVKSQENVNSLLIAARQAETRYQRTCETYENNDYNASHCAKRLAIKEDKKMMAEKAARQYNKLCRQQARLGCACKIFKPTLSIPR